MALIHTRSKTESEPNDGRLTPSWYPESKWVGGFWSVPEPLRADYTRYQLSDTVRAQITLGQWKFLWHKYPNGQARYSLREPQGWGWTAYNVDDLPKGWDLPAAAFNREPQVPGQGWNHYYPQRDQYGNGKDIPPDIYTPLAGNAEALAIVTHLLALEAAELARRGARKVAVALRTCDCCGSQIHHTQAVSPASGLPQVTALCRECGLLIADAMLRQGRCERLPDGRTRGEALDAMLDRVVRFDRATGGFTR
jgi:hypothetical protein